MGGTHEGGKKAAETRTEHDPEAFKKMGEKGGSVRHDKSSAEKSSTAGKVNKMDSSEDDLEEEDDAD